MELGAFRSDLERFAIRGDCPVAVFRRDAFAGFAQQRLELARHRCAFQTATGARAPCRRQPQANQP